MKKLIFLFSMILLVGITGAKAQWTNPWGASTNNNQKVELTSSNQAQIQWIKTEHDFKEVKRYNAQKIEFKFKNTGDKPVLITNAEASCGCTKLEYSKAPIMPGKEAIISTVFDAKELGVFQKSVTIYTNIPAPHDVYELKLYGEVVN